MAKKKNILSGNNRLFLIGGVGGTAAVLIAVFVFGIGIEGILPFIPANEVIPTQLTTQEIQENEQIMLEKTKITENPTDFCPTAITALMRCITIQDEDFVDVFSIEDIVTECGLTDEEVNQCNNEIDEIIAKLNMQLNESPPITNETDSSPNPPPEQVCDILDLECSKKPPIQLVTNVIKTDSQGFTSSVTSSIDVPQLSFFIEDVDERDFQTGQLEIQVKLIGEPSLAYVGTASMDVRIGNKTINQIPIVVNGDTDLNGELMIQFLNEVGRESNNFVFLFMPNFDKFLNEQTTTLEFIINDFIVAEPDPPCIAIDPKPPECFGDSFGIEEASIFSMDIARDDIKLIVTDEGGNTVRVFPSDSRIVLTSVTGKSDTYFAGVIRQVVTASSFLGNGLGCTGYVVTSDTTRTGTVQPGITIPSPTISAVLKDSLGIDIVSGSGTGTIIDHNTLTRNQNYTLLVSTTGDLSELDYGKIAETKSFQCSQGGTVKTKTSTQLSGISCGKPCGTCVQTTTQSFGSLVLGEITCNVP